MLAIDITFALVIRASLGDLRSKKREVPVSGDYGSFAKGYSGLLTEEADKDVMLNEYHRTQEMLVHYDNLNWQIGSILVGSNIVALGFLSGSGAERTLFAAAVGGSFSLFAWILWFIRHASIYNVKNDRLYMIEMKLNMYQHRMVGHAKEKRFLARVPGNQVATILCFGLLVAWLIVLL